MINIASGYTRRQIRRKASGVKVPIHKRWKNQIFEYRNASDRVAMFVTQVSRRYNVELYAPKKRNIVEENDDFHEEVASMHQKGKI